MAYNKRIQLNLQPNAFHSVGTNYVFVTQLASFYKSKNRIRITIALGRRIGSEKYDSTGLSTICIKIVKIIKQIVSKIQGRVLSESGTG